jgi:predicted MPP superfamily phosphohydrolase
MMISILYADAARSSAGRLPLQTQQLASSTSQVALAGSSSSIAWFVQLSDLHINKWVHPEILPDLAAFGQQVLTSLRPGAVLITGDLVDAKTRPEGSHQYEEEWQVRLEL